MKRLPFALLALPALVATASSPLAQKLSRDPFEAPLHGLRVRVPFRWEARALPAGSGQYGVLFHFREDDDHASQILVTLWPDPSEREPDETDPALLVPLAVEHVLGERSGTWSDPLVDESVEVEGRETRHLQFRFEDRWVEGNGRFVDLWLVPGRNGVFGLAWIFGDPDPPNRRVERIIERSVASLEHVDPVELPADGDYAAVLGYHAAEVAPIAGWRVVETPSRKFVVKTSHEDDDFVEEVIERLERSRELFERDFPPPPEFRHVSVVRLCSSETEFHRYGGTSRGVMGWFNPMTTELVLFDAQDVDRNMSFAVMSHEAFHQYCHFLFGKVEAHRWFDEGHGDYYGGIRWSRRGKAEVAARMPGGLDRLGVARELVRTGSYMPLEAHLNASHGIWRSRGLDSYAQSWSIVYMLRQGMLGEVHRKVWRDEYAGILPAYVEALREGYARARAELAADDEESENATRIREADAAEEGADEPKIPAERKAAIWQAAYDAAWGPIDMERFEADWRLYVKKYLE